MNWLKQRVRDFRWSRHEAFSVWSLVWFVRDMALVILASMGLGLLWALWRAAHMEFTSVQDAVDLANAAWRVTQVGFVVGGAWLVWRG